MNHDFLIFKHTITINTCIDVFCGKVLLFLLKKMYRVCKESHVRQIAIVYRTHLQYGKLHFPSLPPYHVESEAMLNM